MNLLTLLSVIIIAVNVLVILIGLLIGYKRGAGKSLVRFVYILIVMAISYILAILIAKSFSVVILKNIQSSYNETLRQIASNSEMFEPLIRGLVASVLGPLFFPLIFIVFQLLSLIGFKLASKKIISIVKKDGDPMNRASHFIGAGVGAIQGFIIASILIVPISLVSFLLGSVNENNTLSTKNPDYYTARTLSHGHYVSSLSVSLLPPPPPIYSYNPFLYGGLTQINYIGSGINYRLMNEGSSIVNLFNTGLGGSLYILGSNNIFGSGGLIGGGGLGSFGPFDGGSGGGSLFAPPDTNDTNEIFNVFANIIPYIEQSPMLAVFAADLLNTAAEIWDSGQSFLGISFDTPNQSTRIILDSFTDVLQTATANNVTSILKTFFTHNSTGSYPLAALINVDFDEGIDYNSNDLLYTLSDMLITVRNNDNTSMLTKNMGDIGRQMAQEAGINIIPGENTAAYEQIKSALEDAIDNLPTTNNYEASVDALASQIVSIAASYNYTITAGQARLLAISLLEYFGSTENITIEGLKEYFGVGDQIPASAG